MNDDAPSPAESVPDDGQPACPSAWTLVGTNLEARHVAPDDVEFRDARDDDTPMFFLSRAELLGALALFPLRPPDKEPVIP